jgi:DNA-3-methyladenine glycosylase
MEKVAQLAQRRGAKPRLPGHLLRRTFFEDSPELVAPRLLGKLLVRRVGSQVLAGRIVEVEAYLGPHNVLPDPAAHAHRGPTPRNAVLFGPAGHAYVYAIYGRYFCMNISCESDGLAGSILLRALDPVAGIKRMAANRGLGPDASPKMIASGPGRLCLALGITRPAHNGLDVTSADSPLQVRGDDCEVSDVLTTVRIGLTHAADLPLRFAVRGHHCVSGPGHLTGRRNLRR